jgi:Disulphide bond corrector protein DsbC
MNRQGAREIEEIANKRNRQGAKLLIFCLMFLAAAKRPAVILIETKALSVSAGQSANAEITVKIKSGYHVQANPASEDYLIPTKLELKPVDGLEVGAPVYPKGQPFKLEGTEKPLATYVDSFVIKVPVKAQQAGNKTLEGSLRYQACDARSCLFPDTIPVQIPVTVK